MRTSVKRTSVAIALALITAAFAATALAQPAGPTSSAAITSEPGKATAVRTAELSAQVVAIDKAKRMVTLKGPKGDSVDIVAGDDVKNFDQIKVGDLVVAKYVEALTLELRKTTGTHGEPVVREKVAKAKPGERPAVAASRQVTAMTDVVAVDPAKSTITIKGPKGHVTTLNVQNPDQFKVVKAGDHIEVTYTEAVALSVEPAPAKK